MLNLHFNVTGIVMAAIKVIITIMAAIKSACDNCCNKRGRTHQAQTSFDTY